MVELFLNFFIKNYSLFFALILTLYLILNNKKPLLNWFIALFLFIFFNIVTILLLMKIQYQIWLHHPVSKYLLPPYTNISYFFLYTYHHIYKDFLWSLAGGAFVFLVILITNNLFKKTLYYPEEYIKIPILAVFLKFPFNFLFFVMGLFLIFLLHLVNLFKNREKVLEKISIKDYWVFLCLFFIILNMYADFINPHLLVIRP